MKMSYCNGARSQVAGRTFKGQEPNGYSIVTTFEVNEVGRKGAVFIANSILHPPGIGAENQIKCIFAQVVN